MARAGADAALTFQRDTAAEVALVCFGLMLAAAADREELLAGTLVSAQASLAYTAAASLLAAGHHALGFSREHHAHMGSAAGAAAGAPLPPEWGSGPPDVNPWDTPSAGELPKSNKLIMRRCA